MKGTLSRRRFIKQMGQLSALSLLPHLPSGRRPATGETPKERFTFIHFTDTHIQPELKGQLGVRKCIAKMNQIGAEFAIHGGDIVFDVFQNDRKRAELLYNMYAKELEQLNCPAYHVIGNHDVFGIAPQSGVDPSDPGYGKRMFEDYLGEGRTYRSFDFGRWHFILLDSIDITSSRTYQGLIDYEQLEWLREDLEKTGKERPIVVATHIPLITMFWQILDDRRTAIPPTISIVNTRQVWELLEPYNVRAVLQGHLHIREKIEYNGVKYITSGAVCGNWWKGLRMGHPEGFAVIEVEGDQLRWRYETYGWQAVTTGQESSGHGEG